MMAGGSILAVVVMTILISQGVVHGDVKEPDGVCDGTAMLRLADCMNDNIDGYQEYSMKYAQTGLPPDYLSNWRIMVTEVVPHSCKMIAKLDVLNECFEEKSPECVNGPAGEQIQRDLTTLVVNFTQYCEPDYCSQTVMGCYQSLVPILDDMDASQCSQLTEISALPCILDPESQLTCPGLYRDMYRGMLKPELDQALSEYCPDIEDYEMYDPVTRPATRKSGAVTVDDVTGGPNDDNTTSSDRNEEPQGSISSVVTHTTPLLITTAVVCLIVFLG